ncbi:helix-turn-helix domain-containing protein [Streptomyces alboflavus]|uniref:helix-turn-helix domain-containing protein n=1 Tax=Streptomyces alboflavus TaxID=67267 RepID=UPI00068B32EF|nr:helix-turn-helix transcriptional regulator [Streptomyces alboflavus]
MTDFAIRAREALAAQGLSMRGAARALPYDIAYLSRVLNGKQAPSARLAVALDELLGASGELAALLAAPGEPVPWLADRESGVEGDIAHVRTSVAHLLEHDHRYGGDQVAPAAVQVWRTAQRGLDSGTVPDRLRREYAAAVAEAAQVAGWLLFVADRQESARTAFLEAYALACQAGDRPMQWFVQDMIAMQGVQSGGRLGEALRIADAFLSGLRVPPRVTLLAHLRRARALAHAGDGARALSEMKASWAILDDSIGPRDPAWTWWLNECELSGHEGEVHLALGDPARALPRLRRARELAEAFRPAGSGAFYYGVAELVACARAGAWRDCEGALLSVRPLLETVSSGRSHNRLRRVLDGVARDDRAPAWLTDLVRDSDWSAAGR